MLEISLGEAVRKAFRAYKERVAFEVDGIEYTYGLMHEMVNRLANCFLDMGLEKGDRIVIMMTNRIEYVYTDLAAASAGLVKVPLNVMLSNKDIDYALKDSGAKAVVLDDFFVKKTSLFFKDYEFIDHIISVGGTGGLLARSLVDFNELINTSAATDPDVQVAPEDLLAIMYTGGTTGEPKGVMHTHKSCLSISYNIIVEQGIQEDDVMLVSAPLPHATGFFLPACIFKGAKTVITNGFNVEEFFKLVEKKGITLTFTVPTMIYLLLDSPARTKHDLSSLRTVLIGGAPMLPRRLEEAIETMGPIFQIGYAQMEAANNGTIFTQKQLVETLKSGKRERLLSCGHPCMMVQIKIVDETGTEVGVGELGEILIKGPHMMLGYWNKEEETNKTIVDGWIHSGDIGKIDEDDFVYIMDRKKDMIITGGLNVYSAEVESILAHHPDVAEVIVLGTPDPKWGEQVLAIVVKKSDASITEQGLIQYSKENLSAYKVPKHVEFRESLPKTPYGKYDKKKVRAEYWKEQEREI
jgi:fatty-acyl-CoA synthase